MKPSYFMNRVLLFVLLLVVGNGALSQERIDTLYYSRSGVTVRNPVFADYYRLALYPADSAGLKMFKDFEYDVHSLLKEFFPQEDVQMYYSCSPDEVEGKNLACTHHEMTDDGVKEFADASQVFKIDYVGEEIAVEWTLNMVGDKADRENPDKEILYNSRTTGDMQQATISDIKTAGKRICTKISVTGTGRKETKNCSLLKYT